MYKRQEVDYGTFMTMTENKEIGKVEVEDNQIIFTNKDGSKIYKTGPMNDPDLTQRLYDAGAEFTRDIVEQTSPLLSVVLTWVLPIVLFIAVGQLMAKKLTDRAGGPGSMMFGAGKSNAKIYVPVSYTHLRAHETRHDLVCRLLLEKKKTKPT